MLTISLLNHRLDYYLEMALTAYYGGQEAGQWFGVGAHALGLTGIVTNEVFKQLLYGSSLDGKPLVQNAGSPDHTCGWDLTFSAPKAVSVLWALVPDRLKKDILSCHQKACLEALQYAQNHLSISRQGKGGRIHSRAGLVVARFDEFTSRSNDPNLHSHCVVLNIAKRPDGSTGALHSITLFRAKMLLGAIYQVELAAKLNQTLGLTIAPKRVGFHIEGVPESLCLAFSKRRGQIEKSLLRRGLSGAVASKIATLDTRPKKDKTALHELITGWKDYARALSWGPDQATALINTASKQQTQEKSFRVEASNTLGLLGAKSYSTKVLLRQMTAAAIRYGADATTFLDAIKMLRLPDGRPISFLSKDAHKYQPYRKLNSRPLTHNDNRAKTISVQHLDHGFAQELGHEVKVSSANKLTEFNEHSQEVKLHTLQSNKDKVPSFEDFAIKETQGPTNKEDIARAGNSSRQTKKKHAHRSKKKSPSRNRVPHAQKKRNKEFLRQYGAAADCVHPERRTLAVLGKVAQKLAECYHPDRDTMALALREINRVANQSFIHIEKPRPFPHSPIPALKWMRIPKIAFGSPTIKWGKIKWRKRFLIAELRIQERRLFPDAPKWSPLHGRVLPSLHLTLRRPKHTVPNVDAWILEAERSAAKMADNKEKKRTHDKTTSHSH